MAIRFSTVRDTLLLAGLFAGMSCAHTAPPPRELADARTAYQRAIQGPALRADPIRLGLAKHVLDEAEQDHQLGAPVEDVRDQAYLSLRLTQTAEAEGAVRMLDERRRTAAGELAYLELRAQRQAQQRAQAERQAAAEHSAQVSPPPATVQFGFNEATLQPEATKVLDKEAEKLKARQPSATPVVVEGHTDSTGDPAYNQDLAERRATAVRDYLVSQGVKSTTVTVEAAGPDKPAADNDTPEGRAENRRVEIEVAPAATPVNAPMTPRILVPEPSP